MLIMGTYMIYHYSDFNANPVFFLLAIKLGFVISRLISVIDSESSK
jgi:hypothetical protein